MTKKRGNKRKEFKKFLSTFKEVLKYAKPYKGKFILLFLLFNLSVILGLVSFISFIISGDLSNFGLSICFAFSSAFPRVADKAILGIFLPI